MKITTLQALKKYDYIKITAERTSKPSPDCSGYVVELCGTIFERKAGVL